MINNFTQTHIGKRKINEDSYLADQQHGLYIVADGVGGLEKGEVASQLACKTILTAIQSGASLSSAVHLAHQAILDEVKDDDTKKGMATTVVALLIKDNAYEITWVGDSRVYLWDNTLHLITKDDSYVELLLESGHITLQELETHPDRNVISQALGVSRKDIVIHSNSGILQSNQLLLLCTDGLFGVLKEKEIIKELKKPQTIQKTSEYLVQKAVDSGGSDNITLMILNNSQIEVNSEDVKTPKIYRTFDFKTGKIIGLKVNNKLTEKPKTTETDHELIDQTKLKEVTLDDRNLLEVAATRQIKVIPERGNNKFPTYYWFMLALIVVLLIILTVL